MVILFTVFISMDLTFHSVGVTYFNHRVKPRDLDWDHQPQLFQWGTCETLRTHFDSPRVWLKLLPSSPKAYMICCPSETHYEKTHAKFATEIKVYRTLGANLCLPSSSPGFYKPSKVNRVMEPLSIQSFHLSIVD